MIRALQVIQVTRDAGAMYARGVDFSLSGTQAMLARLGSEIGMQTTGGEGVLILSTITYVGRYQCKALNLADSSTPPNPYSSCINYGHFVFSHRILVGNTALRTSNFGAPSSGLVDSGTGYLTLDDTVKNSGARADAFTLLPKPNEDGLDGFQAGQFAYLVEGYFRAPDMPGFMTGMGAYAYTLF